MKRLIWILALLIAFALGIWLAQQAWMPWQRQQVVEQAHTLLERIEQVTKLVTVEGHFSEVYDYKDYYGYDWSIFRKKALIRIKAKVSAGYDLDKLEIEAFPSEKKIVISALPQPEIMSIDHELDYYDLTEGTFNSFSNKDLTRLEQQAKAYIRESALQSDLLEQAEAQGATILETLEFMVEGAGWTLTVIRPEIEPVHPQQPSIFND
jgi:hypothetical protein